MPETLLSTSMTSDATTCAETAPMGNAVVIEASGEPGDESAASKPRALNELLGLNGLCDLFYFGSHAFAFMGYAPMMPRPDIEYELRLIAPPVDMKMQFPRIVALIRENKRISLVHGLRQRECCHGWIPARQAEELVQNLCELDQLSLVATPRNPQDAKRKQPKVMATVIYLKTTEAAEIGSAEFVLHQSHATKERGLEGLLEWKVMYV